MTEGLDSLPARVDRIEQKLEAIDKRFDDVDKRFDEVTAAFVEQRQHIEFAFDRLRAEMLGRRVRKSTDPGRGTPQRLLRNEDTEGSSEQSSPRLRCSVLTRDLRTLRSLG